MRSSNDSWHREASRSRSSSRSNTSIHAGSGATSISSCARISWTSSRSGRSSASRRWWSLLRERVGAPVSYQSLAEDLQVDQTTVKRWIGILENLFVIFKVTPWHRNVARSLLKAPKYYFYDNGQVTGDRDRSSRTWWRPPCSGKSTSSRMREAAAVKLNYLRNKDGDEVDFAVSESGRLILMVEVKWDDATPSKHFRPLRPREWSRPPSRSSAPFAPRIGPAPNLRIVPAAEWLEGLELCPQPSSGELRRRPGVYRICPSLAMAISEPQVRAESATGTECSATT